MSATNPIIGRIEEMTRLQETFNQVRTGQGRIVLVAGEAGVGKTVLIEQILSQNDFMILRGRTAQDSTLPYDPIIAVLRDALRQKREVELNFGPMSRYLPILLPEMGETDIQADSKTLTENIISTFMSITKDGPIPNFCSRKRHLLYR
jgi:predicted ATPase